MTAPGLLGDTLIERLLVDPAYHAAVAPGLSIAERRERWRAYLDARTSLSPGHIQALERERLARVGLLNAQELA